MKKNFLLISISIAIILFAFLSFYKNETMVGSLESSLQSVGIIEKESVGILSFGDVMFDRGVRNIIENKKRDPFEYIKKDRDLIKDFDVTIVNLEGPIVEMDREKCQTKAYNFQFASNTPERLKSIGVTMVTIANNHTFDCYRVGFESTKKYLTEAQIDFMGDRSLLKSYIIKTINNKKVAFIGIDETTAPIPVSNFYPLIKKLSTENDYVVVHIHWGTEYALTETPAQERIAHALIDNGASVIFGHHPHVIEPVRIYKGKAIFYSLGNFVFDQSAPHTIDGLGAGVRFYADKAVFTLFPYKLNLFAPQFLKDLERDAFCNKFLRDLEHTECSFELFL